MYCVSYSIRIVYPTVYVLCILLYTYCVSYSSMYCVSYSIRTVYLTVYVLGILQYMYCVSYCSIQPSCMSEILMYILQRTINY